MLHNFATAKREGRATIPGRGRAMGTIKEQQQGQFHTREIRRQMRDGNYTLKRKYLDLLAMQASPRQFFYNFTAASHFNASAKGVRTCSFFFRKCDYNSGMVYRRSCCRTSRWWRHWHQGAGDNSPGTP
jgi:hypothetical protein